jgi:glycosyltransferase involved in cell wall biosynthesis
MNFFKQATQIIVLGETWRDFVVKEIGANPDKIIVLPNAVSGPNAVNASEKQLPIHILFLGKLCPEKGTNELLTALGSEAVRSLDWNATIAGNGEVSNYRFLAQSLGIQERVRFPGWVGPEETEELLSKSSILVLPSHAENLPLCILEAMAFGVCPVATPVGAIPDVICDGQNGFIVPVDDVERLSSTIAYLVSNVKECREVGARARKLFESKYDINRYVQNLDQFYSNIDL